MTNSSVNPLELMVGARLLLAPPRGLTDSELLKALNPWIGDEGGAAKDRLPAAAASLAGQGLMESGTPRRLTQGGREWSLSRLRLRGTGRVRFDALVNVPLVALAAGFPYPEAPADHKRFAQPDGLRAALVWRAFGPPGNVEHFPSASWVKQTVAARVLCERLGLSDPRTTRPPRIQGKPLAMALSAALGAQTTIDAERAFQILAARAVGEERPLDARGLRRAILHAWCAGEMPLRSLDLGHAPKPATVMPSTQRPDFVARLLPILVETREGRFGSDRLFVAAAFDALVKREGGRAPTRAEFDRELLLAAQRGQLVLTRADFVDAMDPSLVERSQLNDRGSVRHLIQIPRGEAAP